MKTIFISYADEAFKQSLKRIGKEAQSLQLFDTIILYTPKDLPVFIKASPLMAFKHGGGYWLWKPYIIWKTLQDYGSDAIIVYVDAGCSLYQSKDWTFYFEKMKEYETIVFRYRSNFDYGWKNHFKCDSPKIKFWTKKRTLLYFDELFQNEEWRDYSKIMGGFIIVKNRKNDLIQQWLNIFLFNPELIIDPIGNEITNQYDLLSTHRHDQSILTPLAYYYQNNNNSVLILDELAESAIITKKNDIAVLATRKRDFIIPKITFKTKAIQFIKGIIGEKGYKIIHG